MHLPRWRAEECGVSDTREVDSLRLHPDSERVPMATAADLTSLRNSLAENGQQDPIDVTPDGLILDGRTRWTLLQELGSLSIQVRVVDIPERDQTSYIIGRALERRHLTMAQKQALNEILRDLVIEERRVRKSGRLLDRTMRIGYSQTDRAAKLGVDQATINRWDAEPSGYADAAPREGPTHAVDKRGRPQPIHQNHPEKPARRASNRPEPLRKARSIPYWSRHFSTWCRRSRPEDREFLTRIDREVHAALARNGITCEQEKIS